MWMWTLGIFLMKANTHMVVMVLVLLELDEYKNNSIFQVDWNSVNALFFSSKNVRESTTQKKE